MWPWVPPISPLVANLFMDDCEVRAISTAPNPPRILLSYVDDTFIIHNAEHPQQFLLHLNSLNLHIKFTMEVLNSQESIPFLDTLVSLGPNGSLITSVYTEPTHTDQYFHLGSKHSIFASYSVFNTLTHRVWTVCSDQELLQQEKLIIKWSSANVTTQLGFP